MSQERRYSSHLSGKGSLLKETLQVMAALAAGSSLQEARNLVVEDNILLKQTMRTRRGTWEVIHLRYFSGKKASAIHTLTCLA